MTSTLAVGYPPSLQPTHDPFPFGNFNCSADNYTGPQLSFIYYDYFSLFLYLRTLKNTCSSLIGPGFDKWTFLVSECVARNMNEQAKANLTSYSYMLTLWPAIVSLFASLGPDASDAAYDSILWSALLALTSGGTAGFHAPSNIPHHVHTSDKDEAKAICEYGITKSDDSRQKRLKIGRHSTQRQKPSKNFSRSQWGFLAVAYAGYLIFAVMFLIGLHRSFYFATKFVSSEMEASLWFFLAPLPAAMEAACRVWSNDVELYEPAIASLDAEPKDCRLSNEQPPVYQRILHVPARLSPWKRLDCFLTGIGTWWRIISHQFTGRPYRLLVRPSPVSLGYEVYHSFIPIVRFAVLVIGLVMQSMFTMYPVEFVIAQTALLTMLTAGVRTLWPHWWLRDSSGADLVVYLTRQFARDGDDLETS